MTSVVSSKPAACQISEPFVSLEAPANRLIATLTVA